MGRKITLWQYAKFTNKHIRYASDPRLFSVFVWGAPRSLSVGGRVSLPTSKPRAQSLTHLPCELTRILLDLAFFLIKLWPRGCLRFRDLAGSVRKSELRSAYYVFKAFQMGQRMLVPHFESELCTKGIHVII